MSELIARRNTLTRRIVRLRMRYMSAGIPAPELQVAPLRKAVAALDRQIAKLL